MTRVRLRRKDTFTPSDLKRVDPENLPDFLYHGTDADTQEYACKLKGGLQPASISGRITWDPMDLPGVHLQRSGPLGDRRHRNERQVPGTRPDYVYFWKGPTNALLSARSTAVKRAMDDWGLEGTPHQYQGAIFATKRYPEWMRERYAKRQEIVGMRELVRPGGTYAPHVCRVATHKMIENGCKFFRDPEGLRYAVMTNCVVPPEAMECAPEAKARRKVFEPCSIPVQVPRERPEVAQTYLDEYVEA